MFQAILFDLDDTLYDLRSYWSERLRRALALVQERYPQLEPDALVHQAISERVYSAQFPNFLRELGVADEALVAQASEMFQANWFDELVLADDALHTLETLRPHLKLGLVTNGPSRTQRPKIERFGLADHMDVIVVSEEAGVAKPDPAIFFLALDRLGVAPAEALFVGDSLEHDLYGAMAAGMPFIWMNRRGERLPDDVPPPVRIITRLAELPPVVEELRA